MIQSQRMLQYSKHYFLGFVQQVYYIFHRIGKPNAQKQREFQEIKKLNNEKYLKKNRRRPKKYYIPVEKQTKTEHKKQK